MGNFASRAPAALQAYIPRLKTIESMYVHPTPEQLEVMNRLVERDQARLKTLPDLEELKRKDPSMDTLLSRLNGTILGTSLDISDPRAVPKPLPPGGAPRPDSHLHAGPASTASARTSVNGLNLPSSQPSSSTSAAESDSETAPASTSTSRPLGTEFQPSPYAYGPRSSPNFRPSIHAVGEAAYVHARSPRNPLEGSGPLELPEMRRRRKVEDDEAGRADSQVLGALLEERNNTGDNKILNLLPYTQTHKLNEEKLELLMEHCCIPKIGTVPVFGHAYAFARAPRWWRREVSDADLKGEPFMWEKKIGMTSQGKVIPEREPKQRKPAFSDAVDEAQRNRALRNERAAERAAKEADKARDAMQSARL